MVCEPLGYSHGEAPTLSFRLQTGDVADCIHMTQNKVAAEFLARGQGLLEIDAGAFYQRHAAIRAEGRLANGFAGEISRKMVFVDGNNGEATAVHGDAVGDDEFGRERRCLNGDAAAVSLQRESLDRAEMLNNPGEHQIQNITSLAKSRLWTARNS